MRARKRVRQFAAVARVGLKFRAEVWTDILVLRGATPKWRKRGEFEGIYRDWGGVGIVEKD
jgi:hypothetical protein